MWSGIRERFDKLWLKGIFLIQKLVSEGPSLLTQAKPVSHIYTSSSPETQQYEHLTQDKKSSLQIKLPSICSELPGHLMIQQTSGFFNIFTKLLESRGGTFWPVQKRTFQGQFSAGNARICLFILSILNFGASI